MDMFTGDMEEWLHHVEVDDTRHASMLGEILKQRDFSEHDDISNIQYAFEMAKWVTQHFEYVTYAHSNEIEGDVLPRSIKSLVAREWMPGGELHIIYPSGSTILLGYEEEKVRVNGPTLLEKIIEDEMMGDKNFFQVLEDTKAIIDIDSAIIPDHFSVVEEVEVFETVNLNWFYPMSFDSIHGGSGMIIKMRPEHIEAFPFGAAGHAEKLYTFVRKLYDFPSELAATAAELAVLAAQHSVPRVQGYFTDRSDIENFATRLKTI